MLARHAVLGLLVLALLAPTANAGWREPLPGPLDATAGDHARSPASAVAGGVPYVAWLEGSSVRVARLGSSGWEPVGSALGSNVAYPPSIAVHGGTVVVMWKPSGASIAGARLGSAGWEPLPALGTPFSYAPSPASSGGDLFVAYQQNESDQEDVRVARLAGDVWAPVGGVLDASERDAPLLAQLGEADLGATEPVLAANGGELYAAWIEGGAVRVARRDGTSWPLVGGAATATGSPAQLDMALAGSTPYVAWSSATGSFAVHVARFDGTSWNEPAPAMAGSLPDLATVGGAPWLAWREPGSISRLRVGRLGAQGTAWEQPSAAINRQNVWDAGALVDVNGIPFVAYSEGPTSAAQDVRAARLEPEFESTTATPRATDATLVTRLVTFGLPYGVAFDVDGLRTASQVASGDPATVVATIDGLKPRTSYTATPMATAGAGPEVAGPAVTFTTTKKNGR